MANDTRTCLVCGEPKAAHTTPEQDDHAWEPDRNTTPNEAAEIVRWVADTHGEEAATEAAESLVAEAGASWEVGDQAAVLLAAEADGRVVRELAADERAAILADLGE